MGRKRNSLNNKHGVFDLVLFLFLVIKTFVSLA